MIYGPTFPIYKYISEPHVRQIYKFLLKNVITCAFSSLLEGCTDSLIEKKNTKINRDCMTKNLKLLLRDFGIKIENIISMNGF